MNRKVSQSAGARVSIEVHFDLTLRLTVFDSLVLGNMRFNCLALVFAVCSLLGGQQLVAQVLYAHGSFDNTLYSIDVNTQTVTTIGASSQLRFAPEMVISPDGTQIFMPNRVDTANSELFLIDPATGLNTGTLAVSYPGTFNTMTAMEFVDGQILAVLATTGAGGTRSLAQVNPVDGSITEVGPLTGIGGLGGLQCIDGTVYGISTNGGGSNLYTVDPTDATTSLVAAVTFEGNPVGLCTALAIVDGQVYTLRANDPLLYSIDISTGVLTSVFDLGITPNSLTAVVEDTGITEVAPSAFVVTRGQFVGGVVGDLASSDNVDVSARRAGNDFQPRVTIELTATSPTETPAAMSFRLEASVFARSSVLQSIDLFNYSTDAFEEVDARNASRFTDGIAEFELTGDLTRFVEPASRQIEARIRYLAPQPRQAFGTNVDQVLWTIQE